jgi:hypothetical protein
VSPLDEPVFCVDVYQNEYLPEGTEEVSAVLTVTCAVDLAAADDRAAAEIIIVDCSGSMARRGKIAAAREATAAAVDAIGDGVAFAVIAGTQTARVVFPAGGGLSVASAQSRDLARQAVSGLRARDLTGRRSPVGPQTGDYPAGAWGAGESRDYQIAAGNPFTPG